MISIQDIKNFLASYKGVVVEIPLGGLAPEIVGIIKQFSGEVEAPSNFIFSNMMANISTVVGRKIRVIDDSYINRLNNFWANVGDTGCGKSPARRIAKEPLKKIEDAYYDDFLRDKRLWKQSKGDEDQKPIRNRIILDNSNTTQEKFFVTLDENTNNPHGNSIELNLDELTDFFPNLCSYSGRGGNPLARFLLLYNCESITIDRLGREDQYVKEPICTIVGGIQPDCLNMVFGGQYGSGFIPRWLFLFENKPYQWVQPNQMHHDYWDDIIRRGLKMRPIDLRFSAEAEQELRKNHQLRKEQNLMLRNRAKHLGEYIIKQNYTVRRLAGIFHVANALAMDKEVTPEIDLDEYRYAESVVDYLIKSATIFMLQLSGTNPMSSPNLTYEETLVQLFKYVPDLNVSQLAKALDKDRPNIQRAKRKYLKTLSNAELISFLSWKDGLEEEYPRVIQRAGGVPNESILNMLLASCQDDLEKFYNTLKKMNENPELDNFMPEEIWTKAWAEHLVCF